MSQLMNHSLSLRDGKAATNAERFGSTKERKFYYGKMMGKLAKKLRRRAKNGSDVDLSDERLARAKELVRAHNVKVVPAGKADKELLRKAQKKRNVARGARRATMTQFFQTGKTTKAFFSSNVSVPYPLDVSMQQC